MRRKTVLGMAVAFLFQGASPSDAASPVWQLAPLGGYTWSAKGTQGSEYAGGRLGFRFHPILGLQVTGGLSPVREATTGSGNVEFQHAVGDLTVTALQGGWGDLYIMAGGGYSRTSVDQGPFLAAGTFDQGGGLHFWLARGIGLNLEFRNVLLIPKGEAALPTGDNRFVAGAGITLGFGDQFRDSDGDGVGDRSDKCLGTPMGARVNAMGCPTDEDGDGVFDGIDTCADTPRGASVNATGCPNDGDGDGVPDGIDTCANSPKGAIVDASGCPMDADGDKVFDGMDQCPGTPSGAAVDDRGCPTDEDGDGVADGLDKCPGTRDGLRVDGDGCPIEVTEKETELLDTGMIRLQDVNFETGKADILPESYPALDAVGAVLVKWPELEIQIGGHTDSRGASDYNQGLSEARARAVLAYLTAKFPTLNPKQFTSVGFGEAKPLAQNNNALNMAKNRRVEFSVMNRDVLKRESGRRKLLEK